jgi:hypothetical protein
MKGDPLKRGTRLFFAFVLFALPTLPPSAVAGGLGAGTARQTAYPTLEQAVHEFVDGGHELVKIQRLATGEGGQQYRLEGTATGRQREARVDPKAPLPPGEARRAPAKAYNVVGGSTRCIVYLYKDDNYGNLNLTTDMDWNDFRVASGLNDVTSSLQTTCGGLWLFEDNNYNEGALFYYAPAYSNLATLPSMNNKISSIKHDLP